MQKAGPAATQQQARELDGALLAIGALVDVLKNKVNSCLTTCITPSQDQRPAVYTLSAWAIVYPNAPMCWPWKGLLSTKMLVPGLARSHLHFSHITLTTLLPPVFARPWAAEATASHLTAAVGVLGILHIQLCPSC